MVKPWHVGPKMPWEGRRNLAGAEEAASILREARSLCPAAGGCDWSQIQKSHLGCCPQPQGDQSSPVSDMSPRQGPAPLRAVSVPDRWSRHPSTAVARGTWVIPMPSLCMLKGKKSKETGHPHSVQSSASQESGPSQFPQPTASSSTAVPLPGADSPGFTPHHLPTLP